MIEIYRAFARYIVPFCLSVLKLALSGWVFATKDQAYDRWEICQQCEHYDPERVCCRICGCGMSPDVGGWRRLFEKPYYPHEKCADNPPRWGPLT